MYSLLTRKGTYDRATLHWSARRNISTAGLILCLLTQASVVNAVPLPMVLVNTEAFIYVDDSDSGADLSVRFGQGLNKNFSYQPSQNRYHFDDNTYVEGTLGVSQGFSGSQIIITGTGSTEAPLIFTASTKGHVAIGNQNANNLLSVGDGVLPTISGKAVTVSNTSGDSAFGLGQSTTARARLKWIYNADPSIASVILSSYSGIQPLILQDTGGKVGIGKTPSTQLDVAGTASGYNFFASRSITGTHLFALSSFAGAGLTSCSNSSTDKLLWDSATKRFSCGTDQGGAGGGLTLSDADARFVKQSGDTMTGALTIDISNGSNGVGLTVRETASFESGATLSGTLVFKARSNPAMPASDTLNVYARKVSGRMLLKGMGPSGVDYPYQPSLFQNQIVMINSSNSTAVGTFGNTVTSVGTLSHPTATETYGWMTNFASAATANATAGTGNNGTIWFRGSTNGANGFFYNARLAYPDSSYGTSTTGARAFVGLSNQTMATMVGSDNPAGHYSGFQYSTNRGDSNWQFVTKNGSTQNVVDTGLTFTAQKVYDFFIYCTPQCSSIAWRVDNVSDGTSVEGSTSSNLPGASTAMRGGFQISTLTTTARNVRMQRVYIEADR